MTAVTARLGGRRLLFAFALAAVGAGAGRALTTTYLPVLLERIEDAPTLIGVVMMVNALAGFGVPIAVGIWSDRRGRRLPYITGGAVLTAGGLVAVGLGNGTSYVALGLAASLVYVGLNALTTAHRAIIADDIEDSGRPAATSAQEIAGLVGAVVAVALGGALIEPAPAAAFALAAGVLAATSIPTVLVTRRLRLGERARAREAGKEHAAGCASWPASPVLARCSSRRRCGYSATPRCPRSSCSTPSAASASAWARPARCRSRFGVLTAVGIVLAGRAPAERVHRLLVTGAVLLGAGLLAAAPATSLAAAALPFAVAARRRGHRDRARLPLLRALRARGPGRALQRRVLRRALRCLRCRAAARRARGRAHRQLPRRALVRRRALVAAVPLVAAQRRAPATRAPRRRTLRRGRRASRAVIPVFASDRAVEVATRHAEHVDEVVLVDDGAPPAISRSLDELADDDRVRVLRLGSNGGKGSAVAAGVRPVARATRPPRRRSSCSTPTASTSPRASRRSSRRAATADVVIGDRRERRAMPLDSQDRTTAPRASRCWPSTRTWVPDTQNGMRLFRREALAELPLPEGGYDAESQHLRASSGPAARSQSVEIPTIYDGEPSHYRPVVDTARVARRAARPRSRALAREGGARETFGVLRAWTPGSQRSSSP